MDNWFWEAGLSEVNGWETKLTMESIQLVSLKCEAPACRLWQNGSSRWIWWFSLTSDPEDDRVRILGEWLRQSNEKLIIRFFVGAISDNPSSEIIF